MQIEWWIVLATLGGPVIAVQTQKFIERATEKTNARRAIFRALMSNRATRMNDDFVRSLNLIDLEFSQGFFSGQKDKAVINAWRSLFGEYHDAPDDNASPAEMRAWNERINDRLVRLLSAMSKALRYDFSEEQLLRGIYYPKGRVDLETQLAILSGLRRVVEGNASLPMKVTEIPTSPEFAEAQLAMMKKSAGAYGEDGALKVRMVE